MAVSKRKFTQWIYRDEVTNREHTIQVFTLVDQNDKISFVAEVRTPMTFVDQDENANTLKARVLIRCADGNKVTWTQYGLVTVTKDGFSKDVFASDRGGRRNASINILNEGFETTRQSDGTPVWRGTEGRSSRFNPQVKPGLPPLGKTERGHVYRFLDTPEARAKIQAAYDELNEHFAGFCKKIKQLTPKEDECPENSNGLSSASGAPSAAASTAC